MAEPLEKEVIECLRQEAAVHFDETGLRVEGKLRWLHTASRPDYTPLFIHENRGAKALRSEASVLKNFKGTAVPDCWAPYFQFKQAQHSLCGGYVNSIAYWKMARDGQMRAFWLDLHEKPRPVADPEDTRNRCQMILAQANWEEPLPQRGLKIAWVEIS